MRSKNWYKNASGRIPSKLKTINPSLTDSEIVKPINDSSKKYPSIKLIEESLSQKGSFHFVNASVRDVNKIIRNVNPNRANDPHKITPKLVKLSANVIDAHLTYVFNRDTSLLMFSLSQPKLHQ